MSHFSTVATRIVSAGSLAAAVTLPLALLFVPHKGGNTLLLFTVALALDWAIPGLRAAEFTLYGIVVWQVLCFAWHAERLKG